MPSSAVRPSVSYQMRGSDVYKRQALDGSGACVDAKGNHVMKPFWEMTDADIKACLLYTSEIFQGDAAA